ncbi:MAG: radical SAM protein [Ardenticatenaceae bacterium]|nr:radical SAM protein [Ardenticatenaceae bacterium]
MSQLIALPTQNTTLPQHLQPPFPTVYTLEITQRCHHNCLGCGNVFQHTGQEMSVKEWQIILEKLKPQVQALRVTGGEPTLHKQFDKIIYLIDSLGIPFVLFTNGNWTNPAKVIQVLKTCANLQGLLISLHGADTQNYTKFVQKDAFASVVKNIQLATQAGLRVATNTLLLTSTYKHIESIVKLAISLGVSTVSFGRYYGADLPELSLSNEQLRQSLIQIAALREKDPRITVSNCIPVCFMPESNFGGRGCTSGFTHCTIGPFGAVRPCTHSHLELGSIQDEDIEVLWQGQQLEQWRKLVPAPCLSCAVLSQCRGGCRATAQELQLAADPLIKVPLLETVYEPTIKLNGEEHPLLNCQLKKTQFGFTLTGAGQYVTLSLLAGPMLEALNGQQSIAELQDEYGEGCLQLIGSLFHKRLLTMIELADG